MKFCMLTSTFDLKLYILKKKNHVEKKIVFFTVMLQCLFKSTLETFSLHKKTLFTCLYFLRGCWEVRSPHCAFSNSWIHFSQDFHVFYRKKYCVYLIIFFFIHLLYRYNFERIIFSTKNSN